MNKKGDEPVLENVIFIIFVVVFFSIMFFYVARAGTNVSFYEQKYAKEIALLIDSAKSGTTIVIDVEDIIGHIINNNIEKPFIVEKGKVIVALEQGKGYSYAYYSNYDVKVELNGKVLSLEIK